MIASVDSCLDQFEAFLKGCPCHTPLHEKDKRSVGLEAGFSCPFMGRCFPQLAAGLEGSFAQHQQRVIHEIAM
eukprot:8078640-Alexandrium_andersonii.AAC.1